LGWQSGSHRAETCQWHVPGCERRTLYFLNFKKKSTILKFKIRQRMVRKFPDKQWNRQNSILFHETNRYHFNMVNIRKDYCGTSCPEPPVCHKYTTSFELMS
jgi:hypothetical protein